MDMTIETSFHRSARYAVTALGLVTLRIHYRFRTDMEFGWLKTLISILAMPLRWFDTSAAKDYDARNLEGTDWGRLIPFIGMHLMCFGVIWVGFSWVALATAVALYFIRMFFVTGVYHRYFSHRTYKTSRWFQFVLGVCGASCVQKGPLWWAAHHRHHHRHSDEEEDVHSPHVDGLYWSHVGWITAKKNFPTNYKAVPDLAKYPELMFLDRFDTLVAVVLASAMFGFGWLLGIYAPELGTNGTQMLIWGFFVSTVVLFHGTCTINSLSHLFGSRRYDTSDHSRNNFLLALITLGEGWHNNHHHYPGATRQGFFWYEIDITYYCLKMLSWTGLIWDLNRVPEAVKARTGANAMTAEEAAEAGQQAARPKSGSSVTSAAEDLLSALPLTPRASSGTLN